MAFVILHPQLPYSWDCRLAPSCPAPDPGTYKEQRFTSYDTRREEVKAKGLRPDENLHNGWWRTNTTEAHRRGRSRRAEPLGSLLRSPLPQLTHSVRNSSNLFSQSVHSPCEGPTSSTVHRRLSFWYVFGVREVPPSDRGETPDSLVHHGGSRASCGHGNMRQRSRCLCRQEAERLQLVLSFRSPLIQSKTIARAAAHIEGVFSSASISGRREVCLLGNSKSSRGDNEDEGWAFTSTLSETPPCCLSHSF